LNRAVVRRELPENRSKFQAIVIIIVCFWDYGHS